MMRSISVALLALLLLAACSSPEQPTIGLYPAIQRGDLDQIERHIKWGADIDQVDVDGRRPLHVAAQQGELVVVKLLIRSGADINALDGNNHSPIYTALMAGRTQVAALLISEGAINDPDKLLDQAAANGITDRDVIQFLVHQGADINHLDSDGNTPLIQAIRSDNRLLVKHLISNGADVNRTDGSGRFPLALANERGVGEIIRLLHRNGAQLGH